jgi:hypothetical protein
MSYKPPRSVDKSGPEHGRSAPSTRGVHHPPRTPAEPFGFRPYFWGCQTGQKWLTDNESTVPARAVEPGTLLRDPGGSK